MSHELVASTYYDSRRITVRNFEVATWRKFREVAPKLPVCGRALELGAGRGNLGRLCGVPPSRIVHTDISISMLKHVPREPARYRLCADGRRLPFCDASFTVVAAFLYDAYNFSDLYREVYRLLAPGGVFLGTLPHSVWGQAFRSRLGLPLDKARFPNSDGSWTEVDSVLATDWEIIKEAEEAGFDRLTLEDCCLPDDVNDVSPHIRAAADALGMTVTDVPIVQLVVARR